jgi:hypothetical protein
MPRRRDRVPSVEAEGLALSLGALTDWLKMKDPAYAAVKREAEEGWGR